MNAVQIGNQIWSLENLDVSIFQNGDQIIETKTDEEWVIAGKNKQPAWCYYDNNPINGEKYGKLYNWYALNDPRELAPEGWRISKDLDWKKLGLFLGKENIADKLKSISDWRSYGNNSSSFSALPGGYRQYNGFFNLIGLNGCWWTSSELNDQEAHSRYIKYDKNDWIVSTDYKVSGLSVRCVKL
jgi:uncharacterized protein (TIGR02145 family)